MADFYKAVPKEIGANIEYRLNLRRKAQKDAGLRQAITAACKHDILFFLNAFCVAAGTPVVTQRGLVPIEGVTRRDLVWDGDQWINQGGAVFKGAKDVIFNYGVGLTADHLVWTTHGWQESGLGYDRAPVRLPDGCGVRGKVWRHDPSGMAMPLRLRSGNNRLRRLPSARRNKELRLPEEERSCAARPSQYSNVLRVVFHACEVQQSQKQVVPAIWWPRHQGLRALERIQELSVGHGDATRWHDARPQGQQRKLRSGQLPVVDAQGASQQHSPQSLHRNVDRAVDASESVRDCRDYAGSYACTDGSGASGGQSDCTETPRSARVYDLLNCGPKRAFTVIDCEGRPLLVHNCFLHEPRPRFDSAGRLLPKVFPFITWEHQDYWFPKVREALGVRDIGVEKCRGEGWTWFECMAALQDWLFQEDNNIGLVSSTESKSDSPGNMGSIMAKIDWELAKLPTWMTGVKGRDSKSGDWYRNLGGHALVNLRRGNQINAFAASPDTGRGDRFTWFALDEHASDEWKSESKDERVLDAIGGATDSILYISTPKGAYGAFHRIMHEPSNLLKVTIDWRYNPSKNRGLYKLVDGKPIAVDGEKNPLLPAYEGPSREIEDLFSRLRKKGFDLDSTTRSPWLDRECDRGNASPQSIAQEHERDYGGSVKKVFGAEFQGIVDGTVRSPDIIGDLSVFDDLTYSFDRVIGGSMLLWCQLDSQGKPPNHSYIVACDIASGDGGEFCSNSALVVIDANTKEQVLEFTSKTIKPNDFADKAIAVAKWFHGAFLAWEHGGPGTAFTTQVIDRCYGNIYKRTTLDKSTRKTTEKVGFVNRGDAREKLFADLYRAVRLGDLVIQSKILGEEFTQYIRDDKDSIHHVSINSNDAAHGDRVIAVGVAVQAMKARPLGHSAAPKPGQKWDGITEPPPGTLAHIIWSQRKAAKANNDWDTRSAAEMAGCGASGSIY